MKLIELVKVETLLTQMVLSNKELPLRLSMEFYPVCDHIKRYHDVRDEAIRKYGELDKKTGGQFINQQSPKYFEYDSEMVGVMDTEFEFSPVPISIDVAEKGGLVPSQLFDLRYFITIKPETTPTPEK